MSTLNTAKHKSTNAFTRPWIVFDRIVSFVVIHSFDIDLKTAIIDSVMTTDATLVSAELLAAEALLIMQNKGIGQLVITDNNNQPIGALNMQDMLSAGVL